MNNIMVPWVRGEYKNAVVGITIIFVLLMGSLLSVELSSGGTRFGFSSIRDEASLEKFVENAERGGRLYPDAIVNSGYSIQLAERENKNISYSVGGVSVDVPAGEWFRSEYEINYNMFFAPLDESMVCVLIHADSNSVYQYKDISGMNAVDIQSDSIGGSAKLIMELRASVPELAAYKNIYILKGYQAEKHAAYLEIPAAAFLGFLLLWQLAIRVPFLQGFSRTGRRMRGLAGKTGVSYRELMERIRKEIAQALYRNGNQYLTRKYLILNASYSGDESKGVDIIPVEEVTQMRIVENGEAEDMNELQIQTNKRRYRLTVYMNRQALQGILDELVVYSGGR